MCKCNGWCFSVNLEGGEGCCWPGQAYQHGKGIQYQYMLHRCEFVRNPVCAVVCLSVAAITQSAWLPGDRDEDSLPVGVA